RHRSGTNLDVQPWSIPLPVEPSAPGVPLYLRPPPTSDLDQLLQAVIAHARFTLLTLLVLPSRFHAFTLPPGGPVSHHVGNAVRTFPIPGKPGIPFSILFPRICSFLALALTPARKSRAPSDCIQPDAVI